MNKAIITEEKKAKFSATENEDWEMIHESNSANVESIIQTLKRHEHYFSNFELGKDDDSTLIHYRNRMRDLAKDLNSDARISEQELDYFDCRFELPLT
jgi:hypothetical protein